MKSWSDLFKTTAMDRTEKNPSLYFHSAFCPPFSVYSLCFQFMPAPVLKYHEDNYKWLYSNLRIITWLLYCVFEYLSVDFSKRRFWGEDLSDLSERWLQKTNEGVWKVTADWVKPARAHWAGNCYRQLGHSPLGTEGPWNHVFQNCSSEGWGS